MGINDEYSRDAYQGDNYVYDSDDSDGPDPPLHPEEWQSRHTEELLDAWMTIRQYLDEKYVNRVASYPEFVDLFLNIGEYYMVSSPPPQYIELWNLIAQRPIVRENLVSHNFYGWIEKYIDT
jgi:hypothetical protein